MALQQELGGEAAVLVLPLALLACTGNCNQGKRLRESCSHILDLTQAAGAYVVDEAANRHGFGDPGV